jgi:hypothetical protein
MPISNNLWRKNGGAPQELPGRDWDPNGLPWDNLAENQVGLNACGWEKAADYPDYDASTHRPVWDGSDWVLEEIPAPPAATPVLRVSKVEFTRLLTIPEYVGLLALEQRARAADLTSAANFGYGVVLVALDKFRNTLSEFIELDHPETILLVNDVLVGSGVLSPERAAQVLANQLP